MWYTVKTNFSEEREAAQMMQSYECVQDVYLPIYRKEPASASEKALPSFRSTISGVFFINVADDNALKKCLTPKGYFYDPEDLKINGVRARKTNTHLLAFSQMEYVTLDEILSMARLSTEEVIRFLYYNDRLMHANVDDLQIVDDSYKTLEATKDTVLVMDGPYLGLEGVIKQVPEKGMRGRKDRKLFVNLGLFCLRISNIRKSKYVFVREARNGKKAEMVSAYRHIDHLIGLLQAQGHTEDAAEQLRKKLLGSNLKAISKESANSKNRDKLKELDEWLSSISAEDKGHFLSLSRYFHASDSNLLLALADLIPDVKLRPFLTPTSGIGLTTDCGTLRHADFTEVIFKIDLRKQFSLPKLTVTYSNHPWGKEQLLSGKPIGELLDVKHEEFDAPDDAYIYYAHVGLFTDEENHRLTAFVNWGDFMNQYHHLSEEERTKLMDSLQKFGYPKTYALLNGEAGNIHPLHLSKSMSGFAIDIPEALVANDADILQNTAVLDAVHTLINTCAEAAVELWQGTRLLEWRHLVQRYVLLHYMKD